MPTTMRTVIYPVQDLARAKTSYAALLGTAPSMDQPYYVGFSLDGLEVGLDPHGHAKGLSGPVGYWHVEDLAASREALLSAGASEVQPVQDVGGGKLVTVLADAEGNLVGLIQDA